MVAKEDLTKTLTVKRKSKQKSGYSIAKEDDTYVLEKISSKAKPSVELNKGDHVVGINGIPADEFADGNDANDLIECIRIVVVPEDNLDEYDGVSQDEDEDEEHEDVDRKSKKSQSKTSTAIVPVDDSVGDGVTLTCTHCNHKNENLEQDEDGDYVCEECGYVIAQSDQNTVHKCTHCGYDNVNLEKDDEGDYVCQECGHAITEDIYTCPECGFKCVNPEPDEEGDRVCEKCGCILPENPDGEEEKVSTALVVKEDSPESSESSDEPAGGQQFDEKGKPTTNAGGKKLTPADMFSPGDVITVTVGKSVPKQDPGLKIEERNGKYYIRKVPSTGLFSKTPVIAGDKILELNGTDSHEFKSLNEMKKILKEELKITVVVLRKDPDASESSASSVDYDEMKAMKPIKPNEDTESATEDDDTAPFDGEECGCTWCPHCSQ